MYFPKDRNCEVCMRTKITRDPCRKRSGEAVSRAEKFGDLITADHNVLSEECESRNKIYLLGGYSRIRPTQKLLRERKRVQKYVSRADGQFKSHLFRQFFGVWQSLGRIIMESLCIIAPSAREQHCSNPAWTKSGRLIPWNVTVTCETFKSSYRTGKHLMNGDLENHLRSP